MAVFDGAALYDKARNCFRDCDIAHPVDWKNPGHQFPDAFAAAQLQVRPNDPRTLFRQASQHQYHVDGSRELGRQFDRYLFGISRAVSAAVNDWQGGATVTGVQVNGATGTLPPGALSGPPLAAMILSQAPADTPFQARYSRAVASGLDSQWRLWQGSVQGRLDYPALAAWPGPVAGGVANTPAPLQTLSHGTFINGSLLYRQFCNNFTDDQALHSRPLFYAIGFAFAGLFEEFLAVTCLRNVLAGGPVPTWSPPAVTAGPVLGGTGMGLPGCVG